jgi:hypothetical protein
VTDCLDPAWATLALAAQKLADEHRELRDLSVPGCDFDPERHLVDCLPDGMRAGAERKLRSLGLSMPLSLDAYIMARNIKSEAGSGSLAEKVAIGEALVNRSRRDHKSLAQIAMRDGNWFAAQSGSNPAMSTRQDPGLVEIAIANLVLSGQTGGLARGATDYFSPKSYSFADRMAIYEDRVGSRDSSRTGLAWIGPVPGVDPWEQFFMVTVPKTSPTWATQAVAGRQVLAERGAADQPLAICTPSGSGAGFALVGGLALLAATLYAVPKLRRRA